MSATHSYFAPAPQGFEQLLAGELRTLGAEEVAARAHGVAFSGALELGYRACLWSRVADRVLLEIARVSATDPDQLYAALRELPWAEHLPPSATFAIDFTQRGSAFTHSRYATQRIKDALVDHLRDLRGTRPDVDLRQPGLRLRAHADREGVTLYVDLAGEALHRRGYRREGGRAPLRENLAAALLLRAGWPEIAAAGGPLLDPVCGAGTLLVEGAMIAAQIAPGLLSAEAVESPGAWAGHDTTAWRREREQARAQARPLDQLPTIVGGDIDSEAVNLAQRAIERAGLAGQVRVERGDLSNSYRLCPDATPGLVIANPPYGERLGEAQRLKPLYASLGETLRRHFGGWRAGILTTGDELAASIGLRAQRRYSVQNGDLECRFYTYRLLDVQERTQRERDGAALAGGDAASGSERSREEGIDEFVNRLRKNLRTMRRWAQREGVTCYRVYDADLPDYALAVDLYEGAAHAQEYAPPKTVSEERARRRRTLARRVLPEVLELPAREVFFKERRRQRGSAQYQRREVPAEFRVVHEGGYPFLVNLSEYLDTGLFLDGRGVRARLRQLADGRSFLNLFAYTCTATVYAAKGGASSTTSVDLSSTYLAWGERNLTQSGLTDKRHQLERADCLTWLRAQRRRFDLIYLAPPRFSRSKSMDGSFDLQRDHAELLLDATRLLSPEGILVFEVSAKRFQLDQAALEGIALADRSRATLCHDFKRRASRHRVWELSRS